MINTIDYKAMTLMNVTSYDDMKEYLQCNNMDCEDFKNDIENGFIQCLTLGTYNGVTDTFTKRGMTENHIVDAIYQVISDDAFITYLQDLTDDDINLWNDYRLVYEYTTIYNVITIDNDIYVELD